MRYLILIVLLTLLNTGVAFAAAGDFIPISPVPNGPNGELATSQDLGFYLNALFRLALAAGAVLAAIFVAIGGFEYIFSEATDAKKNGRLRIVHALYGLGILLMVTMIMYIINPKSIEICLSFITESGSCL